MFTFPMTLYSGSLTFGSVFAVLQNSAATNANNITLVNRFAAANFDTTPTAGTKQARAILQGTINSAWIGQAAAGGASVPSFSSTPTRLLFGGAGSVSQSQDLQVLSDTATFTWDGTSDIIVAIDCGLNVNDNQTGIGAKCNLLFKTPAQEASLQTKTGYSTIAAAAFGISALEIDGSTVLAPQSMRYIVCDGNSLTAGFGLTIGSYPSQLFFKNRYGAKVFNVGVPSATTTQRQAANSTGPLFVPGAIAVLWEVTNELNNSVAFATAVANYWSWCDAVRAQGYKVVAVTVLPRSQSGVPAGFESARQSANSLIVANWNLHADALADVGADPTIGVAAATTNTTYYQADQVHLTLAGYDIVSNIVKAALSPSW